MNKFLVILQLVACASLFANPASPRPHKITQADGSTLWVVQQGNEFAHSLQSEDGYLLLPDDNGILYYALSSTQRSTFIAHDLSERTSYENTFLATLDETSIKSDLANKNITQLRKPSILVSSQKPAISTIAKTKFTKGLVILVNFSDKAFTLSDPKTEYTNYMNQQGYSGYGMSGSVRDYYIATSDSAFQPTFDVYGPVTLTKPYAYYGSNNADGWDSAVGTMVMQACKAMDASIDFSKYDNDGDGVVDFVYVFYAGPGESDGGPENTIWPQAGNAKNFKLDGKFISGFACSNEVSGLAYTSGGYGLDGIGTFSHEFGHVLGLPDIYATNGQTTSFTPNYWDLMDIGCYDCYNNTYGIASCTPPLLTAFERYSLGWLKPDTLKGNSNVQALSSLENNRAFLLPSTDSNEYFLLENRQQIGWDKALPGHGLLIWHIDYDSTIWFENSVNNTTDHQHVDLEEADETTDFTSIPSDAFPGINNITSFNKFTTWSNATLSPSLYNITESDGVICFTTDNAILVNACVEPSSSSSVVALSSSSALISSSSAFIASSSSVVTNIDYIENQTANQISLHNSQVTLQSTLMGVKEARITNLNGQVLFQRMFQEHRVTYSIPHMAGQGLLIVQLLSQGKILDRRLLWANLL